MKFLCLAYYDDKKFSALAPAELDGIVARCKTHDQALHQSGQLRMVASLATPQQAKSIRPVNGIPVITDGPYAETKEQLGSFFLVEAESLEEAARIAALHPAAHLGENLSWGIEVRPIEFFEAP